MFKNQLKPRNTELSVGAYVLARNHNKFSKFDVRFLPNFIVTRRVSERSYEVKNLTTNRVSRYNVRDLKLDRNHILNLDKDLDKNEFLEGKMDEVNKESGLEIGDDDDTENEIDE